MHSASAGKFLARMFPVDLKMKRIYIPADIMNEFGYDIEKLRNKTELEVSEKS
ncbi:MAG: hypothetical protein IPM96_19755 [Ignavibacteria bacterium]|nr:hypothetical protein [Ignavibacteria bacterium]